MIRGLLTQVFVLFGLPCASIADYGRPLAVLHPFEGGRVHVIPTEQLWTIHPDLGKTYYRDGRMHKWNFYRGKHVNDTTRGGFGFRTCWASSHGQGTPLDCCFSENDALDHQCFEEQCSKEEICGPYSSYQDAEIHMMSCNVSFYPSFWREARLLAEGCHGDGPAPSVDADCMEQAMFDIVAATSMPIGGIEGRLNTISGDSCPMGHIMFQRYGYAWNGMGLQRPRTTDFNSDMQARAAVFSECDSKGTDHVACCWDHFCVCTAASEACNILQATKCSMCLLTVSAENIVKSGWARIFAAGLQGVWNDFSERIQASQPPPPAGINKALEDMIRPDLMTRARALVDMCSIIGSPQSIEPAHRAVRNLVYAYAQKHAFTFFADLGTSGVLDSYIKCLWRAPRRMQKWHQRECRSETYSNDPRIRHQSLFRESIHTPELASRFNLRYQRPHEWRRLIPRFVPAESKRLETISREQANQQFALTTIVNSQRPVACNKRERVNLANNYAGVWGSAWRGALARGGTLAGCHSEALSAAADMILMSPDQARLDKLCYAHSFETGSFMAWGITLLAHCLIDPITNSASIGGRPRHPYSPENRWRRKLQTVLRKFTGCGGTSRGGFNSACNMFAPYQYKRERSRMVSELPTIPWITLADHIFQRGSHDSSPKQYSFFDDQHAYPLDSFYKMFDPVGFSHTAAYYATEQPRYYRPNLPGFDILSYKETMNALIGGMSLVRFGDGEFSIASPGTIRPIIRHLGQGESIMHLAMAAGSPGCSRLCVGLVDVDGPTSAFSHPIHAQWWREGYMANQTRRSILDLFAPGTYCNSFVGYPYEIHDGENDVPLDERLPPEEYELHPHPLS